MQGNYLLFEKDKEKRIAWLTFNRPERQNMATMEDMEEITRLLREIEEDDDVKVLIIKGAGECFGSGADVILLGPATAGFSLDPKAPYPPVRKRLIQERKGWGPNGAMQAFFYFAKVCIAQIHGYCYGLHFQLATGADMAVASEDALFTHPAFRYIGSGEPTMAMWIEAMGMKKAKEMAFTGRPLTAREAEQCGLINKVVPRDRLEDEVNEMASVVALQPADYLVIGKHLFETLTVARVAEGCLAATMAHNMATHVKFEPGDFNIMKERLTKGVSGAIREREGKYPPAYRLSYRGRAEK